MTTITAYAARYRPGRRRVTRPLLYRGVRRGPGVLASVNPGYILGMAGGALFATAAILASTMGLL